MGKRDREWEVVFDKYSLESKLRTQETVELSASQIKDQGFQPRLLAKIDHSKDLPSIFKSLRVGILPISIDRYIIGHFNMFKAVEEHPQANAPKYYLDPSGFDTLGSKELTSESAILNLIAAQNMLANLFNGPHSQTISGRRRTPDFSFMIDVTDKPIEVRVNKAQIEVDGGFESATEVLLIEAKNREIADFNIRQLYYPFRTFVGLTEKRLRNFVLSRAGDNLVFREYEFADPNNFSSPVEIDRIEIGFSEQRQVSRSRDLLPIAEGAVQHPKLPLATFPQANSFLRVIEVTRMLLEEPRGVSDLAFVFDFDERQAKYYLDAARYLGLAKPPSTRGRHESWTSTRLAAAVFQLSGQDRVRKLAEIILSNSPFAQAFILSNRTSNLITAEDIANAVKIDLEFQTLSWDTTKRRSSTIKSWLEWIFDSSIP